MSIPSHTGSVLPAASEADKARALDEAALLESSAEYEAFLDSLDEKAMVWGEATAAWNS